MGIQIVTGPRAVQTLDPLFLYPVEPEITPEKSGYFWLYVQKWGKFEPLYLGNESTFWKIKKGF